MCTLLIILIHCTTHQRLRNTPVTTSNLNLLMIVDKNGRKRERSNAKCVELLDMEGIVIRSRLNSASMLTTSACIYR